MGVQYHFDVVDNGSVYRNTMKNACFGRLAAHQDSSSRTGSVTLVQNGTSPTIPSSVRNKLLNLDTDEIVYDLYGNWGSGGLPSRTFGGGLTADFGMSKFLLKQILSDVVDIKKELPWLDEVVTVDIGGVTLKANTNFPADQVFTCLSVVRNLIQIGYTTYKKFLSQGFSKKNAFLLSQQFHIADDAFGASSLSLRSEGDYMMAHNLHMKVGDVERLFRGEVIWRQGILKGSNGYIKYSDETSEENQTITSSEPYERGYARLRGGNSAEWIWTAFLNPNSSTGDFVVNDDEYRWYREHGMFSTDIVTEIFNRWVSIVNRG